MIVACADKSSPIRALRCQAVYRVFDIGHQQNPLRVPRPKDAYCRVPCPTSFSISFPSPGHEPQDREETSGQANNTLTIPTAPCPPHVIASAMDPQSATKVHLFLGKCFMTNEKWGCLHWKLASFAFPFSSCDKSIIRSCCAMPACSPGSAHQMGVVSPRLLPPHEGSAIGWGHGETNRPKCLFVVPLFWLTFQFSVAVAKGADENPSGGWTTLG